MSVSRVVDITRGRKHSGHVLLTLDPASLTPRALFQTCEPDGGLSGPAGLVINGGAPVNLSGTVEWVERLGVWDCSQYCTGQVSHKALEHLASVLGPVVSEMRADPGVVLAQLAGDAASRRKSAADLLAEFSGLADLARGEVERLAALERDARAGALPEGVPAADVLGRMEPDGRKLPYETCERLPWGVAVLFDGRVVGTVKGARDGWRGYRGEVNGYAVRDWLRERSGVSASDYNAGRLRLAYLGGEA